MHPVEERQLLRELHRRTQPAPATRSSASRLNDYLTTLFDSQRSIVECWEEDVAVLGTRRAGKSKMLPGKLLAAGEKWPGTVIYYLHPDGGARAKETLLGPDINLEGVVRDYGLPWTYNDNTRTLTHQETRTELRVRGADDVREARKYRGDKVSLVVTEETQNFPAPILRALRDSILGPALADVGGQWLSIGTVGEVCDGPWYEATRNEDSDSKAQRKRGTLVFDWSVFDNPHMVRQAARIVAKRLLPYCEKTQEELEALLLTAEGREWCAAVAAQHDPSVLREWFGRWVNDSSALFYAFDARRNLYDAALPKGHVWFYVLGGDLGTNDSYAHHVWAVSTTCTTMYEVESFDKPGLHAGQWRTEYEAARRRWNPLACVMDEGGLGKGVCEEWRHVYGIPVEPAEKTHKAAAAATLNAEMREGHVKLLATGVTAKTMAALRKDPKATPGKPVGEDPSQPNHSTDAALYAHRRAMKLLGRTDTPSADEPKPGSPEWHAKRESDREERLAKRVRQRLQDEAEEADESW